MFKSANDPFSNMVVRPNRSPLLKPVVVHNRDILKVSKSAGSIRDRIKLPPLVHPRSTKAADRNTIQTPYFRITTKYKNHNDTETKSIKSIGDQDMSFGDIDEQAGGLNDIMRKYRS
ncbi:hypothetical protein SteCoe_21341 [Stentor coeruleus]|uniref:Uncharacterized protein n=1 Tax=Stentor coeruleus TaxID=5963 RepID=A0A1R2BPV9_9CILI|nr:hypothetical protein SteCoe_21341 [Stentor coeruleus]